MIMLIIAQAICALSLPLQKIVLNYSTPLFLAGFRMLLAGIISVVYAWFSCPTATITRVQLQQYLSGIVTGGYIKYVCKAWAVNLLPVSRVALLTALSPFCTALFSYQLMRERLTIAQLCAMACASAGLVIALSNSVAAINSWWQWLPYTFADAALIIAVVAQCHGSLVTRKAMVEFGHAASFVSGIRMVGGGFLMLLTSLLVEGVNPVTDWYFFSMWVFVLIVVSNLIGHWLYTHCYKYYSPTLIAQSDGTSPFFVSFFGWLFLKEAITAQYVAGTSMVSAGLYLFYFAVPERLFLIKEFFNNRGKRGVLLKNPLITIVKKISY